MPDQAGSGSGPLAGEPRQREPAGRSRAAWAGSWLVWWVLMLSFWIAVDDSLAVDEVLAGAGAAAIAALVADLALYQAAERLRIRPRWLVPALRLPGQVAADTVTVYAALWRRMVRGEQPDSGFVAEPARYGDDSAEDITRRVLLIGGRSLAPNTFALGIDAETDTMVLHQLVRKNGG
jgi:multisubunit Na+/H+ antiporter MnhE subunit